MSFLQREIYSQSECWPSPILPDVRSIAGGGMMGHCKDCIRWYKNAPDYGLNVTEWICDKSHLADDTCNLFIGVRE